MYTFLFIRENRCQSDQKLKIKLFNIYSDVSSVKIVIRTKLVLVFDLVSILRVFQSLIDQSSRNFYENCPGKARNELFCSLFDSHFLLIIFSYNFTARKINFFGNFLFALFSL